MKKILFSALKPGISVQQEGEVLTCSGDIDGAAIKFAFPIEDGARCILLLDPDASTASAFENLICIDRSGDLIWRARLPTSPDVFVSARLMPEGIVAKTWSGMSLLLNAKDGREQARNLTK